MKDYLVAGLLGLIFGGLLDAGLAFYGLPYATIFFTVLALGLTYLKNRRHVKEDDK